MNLNKHVLFTFKNYKSSKLEISMVKVKSKFNKMITSINDKNLIKIAQIWGKFKG